eukprot:gene13088-biopygen8627
MVQTMLSRPPDPLTARLTGLAAPGSRGGPLGGPGDPGGPQGDRLRPWRPAGGPLANLAARKMTSGGLGGPLGGLCGPGGLLGALSSTSAFGEAVNIRESENGICV